MGVLANVSGDTEDAVNVAAGVASWFPSSIAAFTFLMFNLLDSPCLAAIATMAQQMQSRKWFWFAILFQNIFAYIVCLCVYQIGSFVTGGASELVQQLDSFSLSQSFSCCLDQIRIKIRKFIQNVL